MDHSPPPLTRSPVSSLTTDFYPSPDLGAPHYQLDFMYGQLCEIGSEQAPPPSDALVGAGEWDRATAASSVGMPPGAYGFGLYGPAEYSQDLLFATPLHGRRTRAAGFEAAYSRARSPGRPVKAEKVHDFHGGEHASQYPSPDSARAILQVPVDSYGSAAGSPGYYTEGTSQGWPKTEYPPLDEDPYAYPYQTPDHGHHARSCTPVSTSSVAGPHEAAAVPRSSSKAPSRLSRKPPRRLTTKEDANFQCRVKGCGKLFSRSYNYKAHLETHDDQREYPFSCTVSGCDKKFVRKTDLGRHHQSVHAKERNHGCDYCGRLFARKDTLRRHMEDGCSRRFDVGIVDMHGGGGGGDDNYSHRAPRGDGLGLLPQLPPMDYPRSPGMNLEPVPSLMGRRA